jgi:methionyl-tRNA synthetase
MGHSYSYRCKRCGYVENFNRGEGMLIHSQSLKEYLHQPFKLFHHKTHSLLLRLAKDNGNLHLKAAFEVYKCPRCKMLYDKVEVAVHNKGKCIHKSDFRCKECNSRLKRTNIHRLKSAVCPVCHHKEFHINRFNKSLWD